MRVKRNVAVAIAVGLILGGLAATATAGVLSSLYSTPVAHSMIFGSSGNILKDNLQTGTIGSIQQGGCALIGVGDYIGSSPCKTLLPTPYEFTETPISATGGTITYFAVTTTNASPSPGNRVVFSVRLCEAHTVGCGTKTLGITIAKCSPVSGSKTCSWIGKSPFLPFQQWQPSGSTPCPGGAVGICHGTDPAALDEGLIDIVASPGCTSKTCPFGTYDPGRVSWSVAYK